MNIRQMLCLSVGIFCLLNSSFAFGMREDDERPSEHLCPITRDVMRDPVVAADGYSYEREAILQHVDQGTLANSPITGLPLLHKVLQKQLYSREIHMRKQPFCSMFIRGSSQTAPLQDCHCPTKILLRTMP